MEEPTAWLNLGYWANGKEGFHNLMSGLGGKTNGKMNLELG